MERSDGCPDVRRICQSMIEFTTHVRTDAEITLDGFDLDGWPRGSAEAPAPRARPLAAEHGTGSRVCLGRLRLKQPGVSEWSSLQ